VNIDFYENALSKQSAVIDSKNLEISLLHHELEQMKLKRMRERREIKLLQTELEYLEEN
jgi:cell division protein FtsB